MNLSEVKKLCFEPMIFDVNRSLNGKTKLLLKTGNQVDKFNFKFCLNSSTPLFIKFVRLETLKKEVTRLLSHFRICVVIR
jgi:hypothetical protein